MSKLRCRIAMSLDGFVAGPNQSEEYPLGEGGERLHDWVVRLAAWRQAHGKEGGEVNESTRVVQEATENIGGGDVVRQYLAAGLLDELELHLVPLVLGDGEAPGVAHLKYRVRLDRP